MIPGTPFGSRAHFGIRSKLFGAAMALYRLLQNRPFGPSDIQSMVYAFESVCRQRKLPAVEDDPLRELIAEKVIEFAQRGVLDPERLREMVSSAIRL